VSVLITDDDHIDRMRWNTEAALPILQLTSASASHRTPEYCYIHIINVLPANSDSTSPTCITFVLLALIRSSSSLLPFPGL